MPFQGVCDLSDVTEGVALGYYGDALSARRMRNDSGSTNSRPRLPAQFRSTVHPRIIPPALRAVTAQRAVPTISTAAFTMMEIAISLAVIGIALVGIIGVLPIGMNVQQTNRQETVIGQDANVLMEAVRNGSMGYDDLTNYVYAISNYWTEYQPLNTGGTLNSGVNGYTYQSATVDPNYLKELNIPVGSYERQLTNGANIVGLMSTPEFTFDNGNPAAGLLYPTQLIYSNHVVVYCRSMSGPAVEKPPQDNPILHQDSFSYLIFCVNAPVPLNTNDFLVGGGPTVYESQTFDALHELRMTFLWPQFANGNLGSGRETFRTLVAGQLQHQAPFSPITTPVGSVWYNSNYWCYQPQTFTNTP
jgi:type II secretory pathway pseudopilin PulG